MTTRAGFTGILAGLALTIFIYLLPAAWQGAGRVDFAGCARAAIPVAVIALPAAGLLAAWWSGSTQPARCAVLGGLAGGLAGTVVYCLWGAAAGWYPQIQAAGAPSPVESISAIVRNTLAMFLALSLGGALLGSPGGWLACFRKTTRRGSSAREAFPRDEFNKDHPQMALNASITAVPAAIVAAALAGAIFPRLSNLISRQAGQAVLAAADLDLPLEIALLLVLVAHLALALVVPHEARQAGNLCGLDEVKMAAYVSTAAAPVLSLLLWLVDRAAFSNPRVVAALLASAGLSLVSLHILRTVVLPRRASFPAHPVDRVEARWFGTIANSRGPRLAVLCAGCGLAMALPLYVTVLSVLVNLAGAAPGSAATPDPGTAGAWRPFIIQALVSAGLSSAAFAALTFVYIFYLNLGRWFSKWNSRRSAG